MVSTTASEQTAPASLDWNIWLRSQRHRIINFLLGVMVVFGGLALAYIFGDRLVRQLPLIRNHAYYLAIYSVIVVTFAARRLRDEWRAGVLLGVVFLFGILTYYLGWLQSGGRAYMMALLVVGGLLLSPRTAFILAGLVIASYAAFGVAYAQEWLELPWTASMASATAIIIEGAGLLIAIGIVVASLWFFGQALTALTQANREATEARALLAEHARDLEAANAALRSAKEQADAARQRAEEADRVKSQFLASMSHELRTPLNAILTFNDLLAMGAFGPVNDEQVDYLNKSLSSGRHLLALINDVLDVTKIQSGMMKLFVEPDFDIRRELQEIAELAEKQLHGKPVKLIAEIEGEYPLIACDKRRVRQVLLNLMSNAIKFTDEGMITLRAVRENAHVQFSVIDTGSGIAPEEQAIIFEPFIQTAQGIKHAGGTGLGLPITRSLVEAHGGRVWVESAPGQGSAFHVTLPLEQPPPAPPRQEA